MRPARSVPLGGGRCVGDARRRVPIQRCGHRVGIAARRFLRRRFDRRRSRRSTDSGRTPIARPELRGGAPGPNASQYSTLPDRMSDRGADQPHVRRHRLVKANRRPASVTGSARSVLWSRWRAASIARVDANLSRLPVVVSAGLLAATIARAARSTAYRRPERGSSTVRDAREPTPGDPCESVPRTPCRQLAAAWPGPATPSRRRRCAARRVARSTRLWVVQNARDVPATASR